MTDFTVPAHSGDGGVAPVATPPGPPLTARGPLYRMVQALHFGLFRALLRWDFEGAANYPSAGPYLVAINHLHALDVPVIFATVPHRIAVIAYEGWADHWLVGTYGRTLTKVIPVNPDRVDHRALATGSAWLRGGGVLGIAPEGQRSPTGGLVTGQPGAAYLASRTGVPIVPVVAWGQENVVGTLARLRRAPVHVRVGQPFVLPGTPNKARSPELEVYTDQIMHALAALLPESYRGVYR